MSDQKTRPGKGNLQRYVSLLDKSRAVLGTLNVFTQVLRGHTFKPEAVGKAEYIVFYDAPTQPQNGWKILGGDYVQWWKLYHRSESQFLEFASYCFTWATMAQLFGSDYFTTADLQLAIECGALTFNAEVFAVAKAQQPQPQQPAPKPKRERKGGQQKGKAQLPEAKVTPATKPQTEAKIPAPAVPQTAKVPLPVVKDDLKTSGPTAPNAQQTTVPAPAVKPSKQIVKAQPARPGQNNGQAPTRKTFEPELADLSSYDLPGVPVLATEEIIKGMATLGFNKVQQPLIMKLATPTVEDTVLVKRADGPYELVDLSKLKPKTAVVAEAPTKPAKQVAAPPAPAPAEEAPAARPRKARPAGKKAVLPK